MLAANALTVAAQQKTLTVAQADDQYPKAYVCKDPQQTQVDDKAGTCTKDGTPLVEIRLGTAYKCLRGPAEYQADPGPCRTDRNQPKGPVTASVFWTCGDTHFLDPGTCPGGAPRQIAFEERPHGDHNPRHGGQAIFMSPDLYYHVEGTYSNGTFRAYFYNEFTKPLKIGQITGRVAVANSNNVKTGPEIPLTPSPIADGNALEAKIPSAAVPSKASPVYLKLYVVLKPREKDWITDHTFVAPSVDPAPPAPARGGVTTGAAQPSATPSRAPANTGRSTKPQAAPTTTARAGAPRPAVPATPKPAAPATPPPVPPAPTPTPDASSASGGIMAAGAEVSGGPTGAQVVLPSGIPALIAFIKENAANLSQLLAEGQLGGMWYPALNTKDAGLELDDKYISQLSAAKRGQLASAVKQLTVVAWQIDAAGDLGNAEQLHLLRDQFDKAVKDVLAVYGQ